MAGKSPERRGSTGTGPTMPMVGEDEGGGLSVSTRAGMEQLADAENEVRLESELEEYLRDLLCTDSRRVYRALTMLQNHTSFLALHQNLVDHGGVVTLVTCLNRFCWQVEVCQVALERLHELICAPRSPIIAGELVRTGSLNSIKAACSTFLIRRQSGIMVWAMRCIKTSLLSREAEMRNQAHELGRQVLKAWSDSGAGEPEWSAECRQEAFLLEAALLRSEVGESAELDQVEGEQAAPEESYPAVMPQPVWLGSIYRPRLKGDLQEPSKAVKRAQNAKAREDARLAEVGLAEQIAEASVRGTKIWIE